VLHLLVTAAERCFFEGRGRDSSGLRSRDAANAADRRHPPSETERNASGAHVDWQFTSDDARIQSKRTYTHGYNRDATLA
jgi:hypothetical protein